MARMTKEQKQAAEDRARRDAEDEARATYLDRLMDTLELAQETDFSLTVECGVFVLRDSEDRDAQRYDLMPRYSPNSDDMLVRLQNDVAWKAEQRRQEAERRQFREAALAKLSREEQEVLGLTSTWRRD